MSRLKYDDQTFTEEEHKLLLEALQLFKSFGHGAVTSDEWYDDIEAIRLKLGGTDDD